MEKAIWSDLKPIQIGAFAEYLVKMELTKYKNLNVFTAEVDDRGIDFVLRYESDNKKIIKHFDVQVKSFRQEKTSSVFIDKDKFYMNDSFFVALVRFMDNSPVEIFFIPAKTWLKENDLFKDRDYNKPGQTSTAEYGMNVSKKNHYLLEP